MSEEKRGPGRPKGKTDHRLKVEERMNELADDQGRLTPDTILADAANEESPLHNEFEWDDSKAGHLYRVEQARRLIPSVKLVIETAEVKIDVSIYVRDPDANSTDQGYRNILKVKSESEVAREMLLQEVRRTSECLNRAIGYAAHFGLSEGVAKIQRAVEKFKAVVAKAA